MFFFTFFRCRYLLHLLLLACAPSRIGLISLLLYRSDKIIYGYWPGPIIFPVGQVRSDLTSKVVHLVPQVFIDVLLLMLLHKSNKLVKKREMASQHHLPHIHRLLLVQCLSALLQLLQKERKHPAVELFVEAAVGAQLALHAGQLCCDLSRCVALQGCHRSDKLFAGALTYSLALALPRKGKRHCSFRVYAVIGEEGSETFIEHIVLLFADVFVEDGVEIFTYLRSSIVNLWFLWRGRIESTGWPLRVSKQPFHKLCLITRHWTA
mmetsp:Transcript_806/g.1555  ORF Transcript_806/g.1555 Transcript_806/m.1555 type:complete len:265 (+) Transcript_806:336-1130(+)